MKVSLLSLLVLVAVASAADIELDVTDTAQFKPGTWRAYIGKACYYYKATVNKLRYNGNLYPVVPEFDIIWCVFPGKICDQSSPLADPFKPRCRNNYTTQYKRIYVGHGMYKTVTVKYPYLCSCGFIFKPGK